MRPGRRHRPAPGQGGGQGRVRPRLLAHVVTSKCADVMPMSRSTLTDLFHQAASVLLPLSQHLLQCTASADVVWADETPLRVLEVKRTKLGYLWTFLTQNEEGEWLIGYRFIRGRASKTPKEVLGGTSGALVVDAYTGYNAVTLPQGRFRVGCWAHVRRRFVDALATAPEAREALDFILELYRVEAQARDADVVRTAAHRELRQLRSAPVLAQLHAWLEAQAPRHPPKSPLGQAISYVRQQWEALTRFVENERLPLDNNRSEAAPEKSGRRWREGPGVLSAAVQRRPGQPGRGKTWAHRASSAAVDARERKYTYDLTGEDAPLHVRLSAPLSDNSGRVRLLVLPGSQALSALPPRVPSCPMRGAGRTLCRVLPPRCSRLA
nr:IS66 family transposase [Myxococcus xanthus]